MMIKVGLKKQASFLGRTVDKSKNVERKFGELTEIYRHVILMCI